MTYHSINESGSIEQNRMVKNLLEESEYVLVILNNIGTISKASKAHHLICILLEYICSAKRLTDKIIDKAPELH